MMVLVAFQSDAESMAASPSFWPSSWHPENLDARLRPRAARAVPAQHRDLRGRHDPAGDGHGGARGVRVRAAGVPRPGRAVRDLPGHTHDPDAGDADPAVRAGGEAAGDRHLGRDDHPARVHRARGVPAAPVLPRHPARLRGGGPDRRRQPLAGVHPDHPAAGRARHRDARGVQVHRPVEQPALAAGRSPTPTPPAPSPSACRPSRTPTAPSGTCC